MKIICEFLSSLNELLYLCEARNKKLKKNKVFKPTL